MRLSPPAVAAAVTSTHSPMATVRTFEAADFASVLDIFQACEPASNIGVEIGDSKMVEIGKFYCALQIKSCDLQSVETLTLTYSLDKANTCALCSSATDAAVVPHGNFFVLIDSETGQHIGQVGLEAKEGGIGEIRRMAVMAEHRSKKGGAKLITALLDHARTHKLKQVVLTTLSANTRGIKFYRTNGFRVVRSFMLPLPALDAQIELVEMCIDL